KPQVPQLLRLIRTDRDDALTEMRVSEFPHDRRIEVLRSVARYRGTLGFAYAGDRLGIQHDARRPAAARCRALQYRPDPIQIVRACDPDGVIIALPRRQKIRQAV